MLVKKKSNLKSTRKRLFRAVVHVMISFNNTIVSVSDLKGNVVLWSSAGLCGFKGSRKSAPFTVQIVTDNVIKRALELGIKQVQLNFAGPGAGREMIIRCIQNLGLSLSVIKDITSLPHNGCRPPKKRRV